MQFYLYSIIGVTSSNFPFLRAFRMKTIHIDSFSSLTTPLVMKPEGSMSHSQELSDNLYPEPINPISRIDNCFFLFYFYLFIFIFRFGVDWDRKRLLEKERWSFILVDK